MRVLTLYKHGLTMGTAPETTAHNRAKRAEVSGWTHAATRRNISFLRSVKEQDLDGEGFALTLTLKECPSTPDLWHKLRRNFIRRLERNHGLIRYHWVTEWQRRGVPHLHGAFWFPKGVSKNLVLAEWLQVSCNFGSSSRSQHAARIDDAIGWFKYLSKHAARGIHHYQRADANIPQEWEKKTGRMWGNGGEWPRQDESKIYLDDQAFYKLRRIARCWRVSQAREFSAVRSLLHRQPELKINPETVLRRLSGASRRLTAARRMLKSNMKTHSDVRGISEWMPEDMVITALGLLSESGCSVSS